MTAGPERRSSETSIANQRPQGELKPPLDFRARAGHQFDTPLSARRPVALADTSGRVIPGTGGNARPATLEEIAQALSGEAHLPSDAQPLRRPDQFRSDRYVDFKPRRDPKNNRHRQGETPNQRGHRIYDELHPVGERRRRKRDDNRGYTNRPKG